MRKVNVARGVYYVEIPGADLRILCGSPEDATKHLSKRGLIRTVEEDGIVFETGPNAILIADSNLQNGSFANLTEFPILQMLYRQGMILPNHPNNIGVKPLLIGSEDQLRAQLDYIYRGNYGLVSEQEMIEAGVGAKTAKEWMRVKLRFAFNAIRPAHDLIETRILTAAPTKIRNGVIISRLAPNKYLIEYEGDSIEIDLNLAPGDEYESSYRLAFHNIKREYFSVVHCGEGDGWDVERPAMSSVVIFQGRIYLVDTGPRLDDTLRALGIGIREVDGVFHTHGHDDHFAGLTTMLRTDRRIKYFATQAVRHSVAKKMSSLMSIAEDEFSDFFDVHDLEAGIWNDIDGLEVKPIYSPHPVETTCFLFRAEADSGYATYAHMADIISFDVLDGMVTKDDDKPGVSRRFADSIKASYLTVADVKKIDIGGGLIHGNAVDFASDMTPKLVLAHRATPLTIEEREVGSGAPFGTTDVLISATQDYCYREAAGYLHNYFASAPSHQIQRLLNYPVVTYNPESFLARSGEPSRYVFLLLNGQVEVIGGKLRGSLAAGALLGELGALAEKKLTRSFRATSFVNALRIPSTAFKRFIVNNSLEGVTRHLAKTWRYLEESTVFGQNLSNRTLKRLSDSAEILTLNEGDEIDWTAGEKIYILRSGQLELSIGDEVMERLSDSGVCGETLALHDVEPVYSVRSVGSSKLVSVPAAMVAEVPVARWKLLELYQARMHSFFIKNGISSMATLWKSAYLIGVAGMDEQHINLFSLADEVMKCFENGVSRDTKIAATDALKTAFLAHIEAEESLLESHSYPHIDRHKRAHRKLVNDFEVLVSRINGDADVTSCETRSFFTYWLVFHILSEDRRYSRFLSQKAQSKAS